jgi:hypothetical protein
MRSTHTVFGTAIHGARGVLPWITLLALASALAFAMSVGASGLPTIRGAQASISVSDSCDASGNRLLYVGLNTWIPAEPRSPSCSDRSSPIEPPVDSHVDSA